MAAEPAITVLWAFVCDDAGEGIVAVNGMPLVGADEARMRSLEPIAQAVASSTGRSIELVRFLTREHIRTIKPGGER